MLENPVRYEFHGRVPVPMHMAWNTIDGSESAKGEYYSQSYRRYTDIYLMNYLSGRLQSCKTVRSFSPSG